MDAGTNGIHMREFQTPDFFGVPIKPASNIFFIRRSACKASRSKMRLKIFFKKFYRGKTPEFF